MPCRAFPSPPAGRASGRGVRLRSRRPMGLLGFETLGPNPPLQRRRGSDTTAVVAVRTDTCSCSDSGGDGGCWLQGAGEVSSFLILVLRAQGHLIGHVGTNCVDVNAAIHLLCEINPVIIGERTTDPGRRKGPKLGIVSGPSPVLLLKCHRGDCQFDLGREHLTNNHISKCVGGLAGHAASRRNQTKRQQTEHREAAHSRSQMSAGSKALTRNATLKLRQRLDWQGGALIRCISLGHNAPFLASIFSNPVLRIIAQVSAGLAAEQMNSQCSKGHSRPLCLSK